MFGFGKKNPVEKLEKEYASLLEKARDVQRSGNIKEFARLTEEAENLAIKIAQLKGN